MISSFLVLVVILLPAGFLMLMLNPVKGKILTALNIKTI